MERNELLIYATTWMTLEILMLGERSQTIEYILYASFYRKFKQIYSDSVFAWGWGWEMQEEEGDKGPQKIFGGNVYSYSLGGDGVMGTCISQNL